MQIENEFFISLSPDGAYELLLDLDRVTPCVPGAELGEEGDAGGRAVRVTVKLGPMRMTYDGIVRVLEADAGERRATLRAEAREARGQGTAAATITMTVAEADGGSTVRALADVALTGRAAQNGRGIVQDVSRRMMSQMAAELDARYGGGGAPASTTDAPAPSVTVPSAAGVAGDEGEALGDRPAPAPSPEPIRGGRLLLRVLWDRIRALLSRAPGG